MVRVFVPYCHIIYHGATLPQRAVVDTAGGFSRHMRMVVDSYCAGIEMWWIVDSVPPTACHLELDKYPRVWEGYQMEWSKLIDCELFATPLIRLPFVGWLMTTTVALNRVFASALAHGSATQCACAVLTC